MAQTVIDSFEDNPFLALAKALWNRGEDGECIARDLAQAFKAIAKEGSINPHTDEYARLSQEG